MAERSPARAALGACAAAVIVSLYPLAVVAGNNYGIVPLDGLAVARAVAVAAGLALLCLWGTRLLWRDLAARATWLGWLLVLFALYGHLGELPRSVRPETLNPAFAIPYVVASAAIAAIIARPWRPRLTFPGFLAIVVLGLTAGALAPGAVAAARGASERAWRPAADALIESVLRTARPHPTPPVRDIYYIVLDGFGSAATLQRLYGIDPEPLASALAARSLHVAAAARSNYAQTYLSLASLLNASYLDGVAAPMAGAADRRPLEDLVQRNALMQLAARAGYRVVAIGSDYMATRRLDAADVCICPRHGLDEITHAALLRTPLAALPLDRWTYDAHRRSVVGAFEELQRAAAAPGRTFVFMHVVAPHPPFVFAADGTPRRPGPGIAFGFHDANHFRDSEGTYIRGYRDQVAFVTRVLLESIDAIQRRPGPAPVIVVHGDHGPGLTLHWESPEPAAVQERMGILAAYQFPDGPAPLAADITPVNLARALATRYLHAALAPVADRSYFSRWSRPYDFVEVPHAPPAARQVLE